MDDSKVESICRCCNLIVNEDENGVFCEGFCQRWNHGACVDISDDDYKLMQQLGEKSKWFCASCEVRLGKLVNSPVDIENLLGLNDIVSKLVLTVETLLRDNRALNEKFENYIACSEARNNSVVGDVGLKKHVQTVKEVASDSSGNETSFVVEVTDRNTSDIELSVPGRSNTEEEPWKVQQNRRKNKKSVNKQTAVVSKEVMNYANATRKSGNCIIGTKLISSDKSCSIKTVERQSWLFVSRVHPDVGKDEVMTFLSGNGVESANCEKLETKFNSYSSFKIGIPFDKLDLVLSPDFWPSGVLIRKFISKSTRPVQSKFVRSQTFLSKDTAHQALK